MTTLLLKYRAISYDIVRYRGKDAQRCTFAYRTILHDKVEMDYFVAQISYDIVWYRGKDAQGCTKMHKDAPESDVIHWHPMTSKISYDIVRYCLQLTAIWVRRGAQSSWPPFFGCRKISKKYEHRCSTGPVLTFCTNHSEFRPPNENGKFSFLP